MPGNFSGPALRLREALIVHAQSDAAVDGIADRLRSQRAVDEQVGDPALGNAEAEAAAIFEPALVSDRRPHDAVAGHGGDDAGMRRKRLHVPAIDVAFDAAAEQMRSLSAELDEAGAIGAGCDRGVERIERYHRARITL